MKLLTTHLGRHSEHMISVMRNSVRIGVFEEVCADLDTVLAALRIARDALRAAKLVAHNSMCHLVVMDERDVKHFSCSCHVDTHNAEIDAALKATDIK